VVAAADNQVSNPYGRTIGPDGGPAVDATLSASHELVFDSKGDPYFAERDQHVIRTTAAGTGVAGYGGDGGPGPKAQLRQPHSIIPDKDGRLLICDLK
jgi:hypothetical protein